MHGKDNSITTLHSNSNHTHAESLPLDTNAILQAAEAALAAKHEAHALLDTLFATAPVGLAFVDRDLRVVRINEALAAINGLAVADHCDREIADVVPALAHMLVPLYQQVLATGQPIVNQEIIGETPAKPGHQRQWLASYYPVMDSQGVPLGVGVVVVEITERMAADAALRAQQQQLQQHADDMQALSIRLVQAQENERRVLARELHDEIGQLLTGLNMVLEAPATADAPQLQARLHSAQEVVTDLTSRVRQLSLDLRPSLLDDLGLLPTLLWHLRRYTEQTQIAVDFKHNGLDATPPPQVAIAAYRIVQEGLTNIARHAQVGAASVCVWIRQGLLTITIEDDGRGFDVDGVLQAGHSLGLVGMRERALLLGGQCTIDSTPREGTRIIAMLPLNNSPTTMDAP
jgi:PAS domain S-box-containing protein